MNINPPSERYIVMPGRWKKNAIQDVEKQASRARDRRLRGISWMPNKVRNHLIAMIGEFVGTFMFLFFAFSATQVANTTTGSASPSDAPNTSNLLYIALAFGFSLAVNAWVFFRISGGLFNPAVTLGMCLIGAIGWIRGSLIFITQIVGAIAASGIVSALFPNSMNVRTTLNDTSVVRGLFIEMFLTAMLVFTIFMLAAEKHKSTFLAPVGIGLALFIAEMSGVYFTGGSLNPARSFGPDVVLHTFDSYHWIYWIGPFLGSLLAVVLFRLIKTLEYETANPGQDFDEHEAAVFQPTEDAATAEEVRRPTGQEISTDQLGTPMVPTATNYSNSPSAYNSSPGHSHEPRHHSPGGTPRSSTKQNGYTHKNKHVQHDSLITSNESHSSNYTQQTFTLQQASRAGGHAHEPHQQDVYHVHSML
ncbi:Major intrinsic protein [Botryosphaeria dothidea]|uniref:Major intrinsic protein n=1 Tax=Botryosphaeria dothidea TaxID=55169 RepID=A0A8H4IPG1_9PEZI|nr:Major intrinsic protein [Botryosphaeria dothidea]